MPDATIHHLSRPRRPVETSTDSPALGQAFDTAVSYALLAGILAIQATIALGLVGLVPLGH